MKYLMFTSAFLMFLLETSGQSSLVPPTGPPSTSSVDAQGYLLRNGERFFPVGSYGLSFRVPIEERKRALRIVGEAGFNFAYLSAIYQVRYEELLNLADSLGVSVLGGLTKLEYDEFDEEVRQSVARYRDYPALLGWQLIDDGDNAWELERDGKITADVPEDMLWTLEDIRKRNRIVKEADSTHVTYQTMTGYTAARREAVDQYAPLADAFALQIYPIEPLTDYDVADANALTQTYYRTLDYVRVAEANGQPMIMNSQTFAWPVDPNRDVSNPDSRYPTPAELRNMHYVGLAAGVKGILSYDFSFDLYENQRPLWDEFVAIKDDILDHDDFYLHGDLTRYDTGDSTLIAAYYAYQDQLLLIVANTDYDQVKEVTITLPGNYDSAAVLDERMPTTLALNNNRISGVIDPVAVQVYTLTQSAPTSAANGQVVVRAQGDCGDEIMELQIDGQTVQQWNVSTTSSDYTYEGFGGGQVSVHFVNDRYRDGGACEDSNLAVDYLEVCGVRYKTKTVATKTASCCTWPLNKLYTNGNFDFGTLSCPSGGGQANGTDQATVARVGNALGGLVYPNPASETLTVEGTADYQLTLYDLTGRPVVHYAHLHHRATLDISHLRPGVYTLRMHDDQHPLRQQKIIVE